MLPKQSPKKSKRGKIANWKLCTLSSTWMPLESELEIMATLQTKPSTSLLASGSMVKEVLGMWVSEKEGAKFWLQVVTELRNRGVEDIFVACVDGLKGFPEAIETVFPKTQVQLCIVHMVRHSLNYVTSKQRKEVADDLKLIYQSTTAEQAEMQLNAFSEKWDKKHPTISRSWRRNWEQIIPFFSYPPEIRKVIYTTNLIESLNMSLRKVTKNRGSFPMTKRCSSYCTWL